jgi:hypothetical protein
VRLKENVSCLNRSLLGQFLREICPFKKMTHFFVPHICGISWSPVKYDDDDKEEITHREVTKYVQQANLITYTPGWSNAYKALVQEEEYRFQKAFNAVR